MVMRNLLENRCLVKNMDGQPVGRQSIGGGVNPRECTDVRLAPKGRHRIGGVRKSPSETINLSPLWGFPILPNITGAHAPAYTVTSLRDWPCGMKLLHGLIFCYDLTGL